MHRFDRFVVLKVDGDFPLFQAEVSDMSCLRSGLRLIEVEWIERGYHWTIQLTLVEYIRNSAVKY